MICNLRTVDDEQMRTLLAHPEEIQFFLYGPQALLAPKVGFLRGLFGGKREQCPPPAWDAPSPDDETDLDKAWHGIHFLLTGTAWEGDPPWCYLVTGGTDIGDVDVGYGPARGLTSAEAKQFSAALSGLSPEDLRRRFDPQKMKGEDIYPSIWDRDPKEDDALGYLLGYFAILGAFVARAARDGKALLIYLN